MSPALVFPSPPLADAVVALRPWGRDDIHDLARLCRDPAITLNTRVPEDYTPEIGAFFVDGSPARARSGDALELAIVARAGGELLGSVALQSIDWAARTGEIGYWVGAAARGAGLATHAARLLSGWALGDGAGLTRLRIATLPDNEASQRVALAAGYTRLGLFERHQELRGVMRDCVVFELRADS